VRISIELGGNGHKHPGTILVIVPVLVIQQAATYCIAAVAGNWTILVFSMHLSFCSSVGRMSEKLTSGFFWNFLEGMGVAKGRIKYILVVIPEKKDPWKNPDRQSTSFMDSGLFFSILQYCERAYCNQCCHLVNVYELMYATRASSRASLRGGMSVYLVVDATLLLCSIVLQYFSN